MTIYCGTGKVDITPALGTPLAGYAGTIRKASEVHDPLHARIIVVKNKNNEEQFVIISLDLVGIDRFYVEKLTHQINNRFKIPIENVFVHATHTHSASGGIFNDHSLIARAFKYMNAYLSYEDEIVNYQHEQILKEIESALYKFEPCKILYGEDTVEEIGTNRNLPDQPYDSRLRVIEFRFNSGDKTVLYHFACHPTVMHSSNTSISADLPGVTSKELEDREDIRLALFLNGPSADISTRFTRKESSFKELNRLGKKLSNGVLQILKRTKIIESKPFKSNVANIRLATRKIPDSILIQNQLDDLNKQYKQMESEDGVPVAKLRQLESKIEGVSTLLDIGDNLHGIDKVDTQLQILRIGGVALLSIPGEFYFESGQEIIDKFAKPILIAGNTNDHLGYIVPNSYYDEDHYESYMTLLKKGSDDKVKNIAIDELREIFNKS